MNEFENENYNDDIDDDFDNDFDDDDDEIDDDGDEEESGFGDDDNEDGYGDEYDPDEQFNDEEENPDELQEKDKQEGKDKKDNEKGEGESDKKQGFFAQLKSKANDAKSNKKIKEKANSMGFTGSPVKTIVCPHCHKHSLFNDKVGKTFIRGVGAYTISVPTASSVVRWVCFNPSCSKYWPRTGASFSKDSTGGFKTHNSLFHIPK